MAIFGPRSKGFTYSPTRVDEGTSYMWSREIYGVKYSFTRVIMPDGELRWYMSKWIPSPYIDPAPERPWVSGFGCVRSCSTPTAQWRASASITTEYRGV